MVARQIEVSLYHTFVSPLLNGLPVGSLPQQQANGSENDAFASSRLTGDNREAVVEVDVQFVYQRKVLDVKMSYHSGDLRFEI